MRQKQMEFSVGTTTDSPAKLQVASGIVPGPSLAPKKTTTAARPAETIKLHISSLCLPSNARWRESRGGNGKIISF